jgi:hypothetical protein
MKKIKVVALAIPGLTVSGVTTIPFLPPTAVVVPSPSVTSMSWSDTANTMTVTFANSLAGGVLELETSTAIGMTSPTSYQHALDVLEAAAGSYTFPLSVADGTYYARAKVGSSASYPVPPYQFTATTPVAATVAPVVSVDLPTTAVGTTFIIDMTAPLDGDIIELRISQTATNPIAEGGATISRTVPITAANILANSINITPVSLAAGVWYAQAWIVRGASISPRSAMYSFTVDSASSNITAYDPYVTAIDFAGTGTVSSQVVSAPNVGAGRMVDIVIIGYGDADRFTDIIINGTPTTPIYQVPFNGGYFIGAVCRVQNSVSASFTVSFQGKLASTNQAVYRSAIYAFEFLNASATLGETDTNIAVSVGANAVLTSASNTTVPAGGVAYTIGFQNDTGTLTLGGGITSKIDQILVGGFPLHRTVAGLSAIGAGVITPSITLSSAATHSAGILTVVVAKA